MNLPTFKYHPQPLRTGSIKSSDALCVCCGRATGFIYHGPAYCEADLVECICPWCIADGTARSKFEVEFTDTAGVGGYGLTEPVSSEITEKVAFNTPGFYGWQQERWLTCCGDAAAYVGRAGHAEVLMQWPTSKESIQAECGLSGSAWDNYFSALNSESSPTAYIFQCLHCGKHKGYSDCD